MWGSTEINQTQPVPSRNSQSRRGSRHMQKPLVPLKKRKKEIPSALKSSRMDVEDGVAVLNFIFNWKIIALQCCDDFRHTTIRKHMSPPSWTSLPLTSSHPARLRHHRAPGRASCGIRQLPNGYFTRSSVCTSMLVSQFVPRLSSPAVSTSLFSTPASLLLPCK